jgi:putative FmdB family regulatory protein
MPLFEYKCDQCHRRFTVLVGVTAEADPHVCPHCGGVQATRRVTRFARVRGEEDILEGLADPTALGDVDDPRTMRRWAREVGGVMGEDLGDEFEEYLDSAESEE